MPGQSAPKDFKWLRGRLVGISDRSLLQHIELYEGYVRQLQAIEAQYPMLAPPAEFGDPDKLVNASVASLKLEPVGELASMIRRLARELRKGGVPTFMPLTYLGESDWWTTDRGISINVPWFLANPTLWAMAARNRATTYTPESAMKCLRHEAGHAVCYAWELWRSPIFLQLFGDSREPYKDVFPSDARSEDFVEYLTDVPEHYAQKHPDEDFAESFACWLDPSSNWRDDYAPWPKALEKLQWIDRLARAGVFAQDPPNIRPGRPEPYTRLKGTVGDLLGVAEGARPFHGLSGWSEHAELLRREPHVWNAVRLHESYFGALDGAGSSPGPLLTNLAVAQWGSLDAYLRDLRAAAGATSPGWAVTQLDPETGKLRNALVEEHTSGLLAGCPIVLALDCWEHAYAPDFGARKDVYLAALFKNLDWPLVEQRLESFGARIPRVALDDEELELPEVTTEGPSGIKEAARAKPMSDNEAVLLSAIDVVSDPSPMDGEIDAAFAAVMDTEDPDIVEAFRQAVLALFNSGEEGKKRAQRAMEGRVAVEREVHRATGKVHKQIFWVLEQDIKTGDRKVGTAEAGLPPAVVEPKRRDRAAIQDKLAHYNGLTNVKVGFYRWKIREAIVAGKEPKPEHVAAFGVKNVHELNALFQKHGADPIVAPPKPIEKPAEPSKAPVKSSLPESEDKTTPSPGSTRGKKPEAEGQKSAGGPVGAAFTSPSLEALAVTPIKSVAPVGKSGMNSTVMVQLADGSKGYFKPAHGEVDGLRPDVIAGTYYKREAAAYQLDKAMGIGLVLETTVRQGRAPGKREDDEDSDRNKTWEETLKTGVGSIQREAPPENIHFHAKNWDVPALPKSAIEGNGGDKVETGNREAFQRMRLLDIVSGNTDRHDGNWMRRFNEKGELVPVPIDHGLAFPLNTQIHYARTPELGNPTLQGPLEPAVHALIQSADYHKVGAALEASGLEPKAVLGALSRLAILKDYPEHAAYAESKNRYDAVEANANWMKVSKGFTPPREVLGVMKKLFPDYNP